MNIEQALTRRVPAAAKLHTARSRNDQVATDMRLFLKHACAVLRTSAGCPGGAPQAAAEADATVIIPGYTHLQRAQPVRAAHHLLAWIEMLERDRRVSPGGDKANGVRSGSAPSRERRCRSTANSRRSSWASSTPKAARG